LLSLTVPRFVTTVSEGGVPMFAVGSVYATIQEARAARERLRVMRDIVATRRAKRQAAMETIRKRLEGMVLADLPSQRTK